MKMMCVSEFSCRTYNVLYYIVAYVISGQNLKYIDNVYKETHKSCGRKILPNIKKWMYKYGLKNTMFKL